LPLEETLSRTPRAPDLNVDFVFGDCSTCRLLSVVDRAFSTSTLKSGGRGSPSRQDFYTKQKMEFYILLANFLPSTVPMRGCWVCATTTMARQVRIHLVFPFWSGLAWPGASCPRSVAAIEETAIGGRRHDKILKQNRTCFKKTRTSLRHMPPAARQRRPICKPYANHMQTICKPYANPYANP